MSFCDDDMSFYQGIGTLLAEEMKKRIMVLDGAMSTMIQTYGFGEKDFRGTYLFTRLYFCIYVCTYVNAREREKERDDAHVTKSIWYHIRR